MKKIVAMTLAVLMMFSVFALIPPTAAIKADAAVDYDRTDIYRDAFDSDSVFLNEGDDFVEIGNNYQKIKFYNVNGDYHTVTYVYTNGVWKNIFDTVNGSLMSGHYFNELYPTSYTIESNTDSYKKLVLKGTSTGDYSFEFDYTIEATTDSPLIHFVINNHLPEAITISNSAYTPQQLFIMEGVPSDMVSIWQEVPCYQWEGDAKWNSCFPVGYIWTDSAETGIFYNMEPMDWFTWDGVNRFAQYQVRKTEVDGFVEFGFTNRKSVVGKTIPAGDMKFDFYLYGKENTKKPTKLEALDTVVKNFAECFPAEPDVYAKNYIEPDAPTTYEYFCSKMGDQLLLNGLTYQEVAYKGDTVNGLTDDPVFTENSLNTIVERPDYQLNSAYEPWYNRTNIDGSWHTNNNAFVPWLAFERLNPNATWAAAHEKNYQSLRAYYDRKNKLIRDFITTPSYMSDKGVGGHFTFQFFNLGIETLRTSEFMYPEKFDPAISGKFIQTLDGVKEIGQFNNYLMPQLVNGITKLENNAVDIQDLVFGAPLDVWTIGWYSYYMCLGYDYTNDPVYLEEAKKAVEFLFTGITFTESSSVFTKTYTDPYEFPFNVEASAMIGCGAAHWVYRMTGNQKYIEYAEYFKNVCLRMMHWYESNYRNHIIEEEMNVAGLFNPMPAGNSPTPWENIYTYMGLLGELKNEDILMSELTLRMFNQFKENGKYFIGATWNPAGMASSSYYHSQEANYLVSEDFYTPERGAVLGAAGPCVYMTNHAYYCYLIYEAFLTADNRSLMALNIDLFDASYDMLNGTERNFIVYNPTDEDITATLTFKHLDDKNYTVAIKDAIGNESNLSKSASALTSGISQTIKKGEYIRIRLTPSDDYAVKYQEIHDAQKALSKTYAALQDAGTEAGVDAVSEHKATYLEALTLYEDGDYAGAIETLEADYDDLTDVIPDNYYRATADVSDEGNVTVTVKGNGITSYQLYAELRYTDGSTPYKSWELIKAYADPDNGDGTFSYVIPVENRTYDGIYNFYIKAKADTELVYTATFSAVMPSESIEISQILADGEIFEGDTLYKSDLSATVFKAEVENKDAVIDVYLSSNGIADGFRKVVIGNNTYGFVPKATGLYTIKFVSYNKDNPAKTSEKLIKVIVNSSGLPTVKFTKSDLLNNYNFTEGDTLSVDIGDNITAFGDYKAKYKYTIGEKNRGPLYQTDYIAADTISYPLSYPGIYTVGAYVSANDRDTYTDGILKTVNVTRTNGTVTANYSITGDTSLRSDSISIGDTVNITVRGTGLTSYEEYEYSFWRVDAAGTYLVKDWSSSNSLKWVPARNGNYKIYARIRGAKTSDGTDIPKNAGSYEAEIPFLYTVGTINTVSNLAVTTSAVNNEYIENKAVTLSATSDYTEGDLLYKFSVVDEFLGETVVQRYSPSNQCIWYPRRDGTFTVKVSVIDSKNYGYSDAVASTTVDISAEDGALYDDFSDLSGWGGTATIAPSTTGVGATVTKTSAGQELRKTYTIDVDAFPLIELNIAKSNNGALHVLVDAGDGAGTIFLTDMDPSAVRSSKRLFRLSLKRKTGWTGVKTFTLILASEGGVGNGFDIEYIKSVKGGVTSLEDEFSDSPRIWRPSISANTLRIGNDTNGTKVTTTVLSDGAYIHKEVCYNVDRYPSFNLTVTGCDSASNATKVYAYDGTTNYVLTPTPLAGNGTFTVNVKDATGWTGTKAFALKLIPSSGRIRVYDKIVANEVTNYSISATFTPTYNYSLWEGAATIASASSGTGATITKTDAGQEIYSYFNVDLNEFPVFEIKLLSTDNAGLHVLMDNGTGNQFITVGYSRTEPGTYEFNIPEITGWSGNNNIKLILAAEGANAGNNVTVEYFKFKPAK